MFEFKLLNNDPIGIMMITKNVSLQFLELVRKFSTISVQLKLSKSSSYVMILDAANDCTFSQ